MSARDAASAAVTGLPGDFAGSGADRRRRRRRDRRRTADGAGLPVGAAFGFSTSCADTGAPLATDPAMTAAASGDISTLPWPIMEAACSVPSASPGTEPRNAAAPRDGASTATPRDVAADSSWAWLTLSRALMNAVLQECAKASRRVTEPSEEAG